VKNITRLTYIHKASNISSITSFKPWYILTFFNCVWTLVFTVSKYFWKSSTRSKFWSPFFCQKIHILLEIIILVKNRNFYIVLFPCDQLDARRKKFLNYFFTVYVYEIYIILWTLPVISPWGPNSGGLDQYLSEGSTVVI